MMNYDELRENFIYLYSKYEIDLELPTTGRELASTSKYWMSELVLNKKKEFTEKDQKLVKEIAYNYL